MHAVLTVVHPLHGLVQYTVKEVLVLVAND